MAHNSPVTEDGDPIGDARDLLQPVRDVYDCNTFGPELLDDPEERLGLVMRENGGRYMEDQQTSFAGHGLRDLRHLSGGERKICHHRVHRKIRLTETIETRAGVGGLARAIHQSAATRFRAKRDVLCDGHSRNEHELLMNHANAVRVRDVRRVQAGRRGHQS